MDRYCKRQHVCNRDRRGVIVLIVMVCLLLVTMIGGSLLKLGLTQRRQARREQMRQQAMWLAESGIERAAAQLRINSDYEGEDWTLAGTDSIRGKQATVKISIQQSDESADRRTIAVVADFPRDTDQRVRISKQVVIDL